MKGVRQRWGVGLPCFYCNVDSAELRFFVIAIIGGLVLFSVLIFLGLYLRGAFKNPESMNDYALRCEED